MAKATKLDYIAYIAKITNSDLKDIRVPFEKLTIKELDLVVALILKKNVPVSYFMVRSPTDLKSVIWVYCNCGNLRDFPFLEIVSKEETEGETANADLMMPWVRAKYCTQLKNCVKLGLNTYAYHALAHKLDERIITLLYRQLVNNGVDFTCDKRITNLQPLDLETFLKFYDTTGNVDFSLLLVEETNAQSDGIRYVVKNTGSNKKLQDRVTEIILYSRNQTRLLVRVLNTAYRLRSNFIKVLDLLDEYDAEEVRQMLILEHHTGKQYARGRGNQPLDNYLLDLGADYSTIYPGNHRELTKLEKMLLECELITGRPITKYKQYVETKNSHEIRSILLCEELDDYINLNLSNSEFTQLCRQLTSGSQSKPLKSVMYYYIYDFS